MDGPLKERIIPIQLESRDANCAEGEGLDVRSELEVARRPRLANVNVPEHIVICLDVCYDDCNTLFRLEDGTTFTHLNMLKRVLEFVVHTKLAINPRTQFALVILRDRESRWLHDFTSSARELLARLDPVVAEESTTAEFPLASLFNLLEQHVAVPSCEGAGLVAPAYVVRALLVYARSRCVPRLPAPPARAPAFLRTLRAHPYLYIDILYAHEEDCSRYKCEEIYDALQDVDCDSYVVEVGRSAARAHEAAAKLLAHPLQRVAHRLAHYVLPARAAH